MKHIYSNTKDGHVKVDKIDADMYLFQSALLSKQKKRSMNVFALTLFLAMLSLVILVAYVS